MGHAQARLTRRPSHEDILDGWMARAAKGPQPDELSGSALSDGARAAWQARLSADDVIFQAGEVRRHRNGWTVEFALDATGGSPTAATAAGVVGVAGAAHLDVLGSLTRRGDRRRSMFRVDANDRVGWLRPLIAQDMLALLLTEQAEGPPPPPPTLPGRAPVEVDAAGTPQGVTRRLAAAAGLLTDGEHVDLRVGAVFDAGDGWLVEFTATAGQPSGRQMAAHGAFALFGAAAGEHLTVEATDGFGGHPTVFAADPSQRHADFIVAPLRRRLTDAALPALLTTDLTVDRSAATAA